MIRTGFFCLSIVMSPALAFGQVGCLPPEEPFPYEPPNDDPELRALINEQYQDYVREVEAYLNCLNREGARAREEAQAVIERWVRYYGDAAALRFEQPTD